nr:MAG TPA: hypothetical protein [Bacteriophage sp.]
MRVLVSDDGIITARIVFGHSPHRPARSLRSRAGFHFLKKSSYYGCSFFVSAYLRRTQQGA